VILLVVLLCGVSLWQPAVAYFQAPELETAWVCPMHPDFTMDIMGQCPRCGMNLVRSAPFDVRDYRLDFRTSPAVAKAGEKATLFFKVSHPGSGATIQKFESVHERQYHLFVISQNMEHFEHIHPVEQSDGTWTIGNEMVRYSLARDGNAIGVRAIADPLSDRDWHRSNRWSRTQLRAGTTPSGWTSPADSCRRR